MASLHVYGDTKGLIGYRPRLIEETEDKRYNVTFTVHWLIKNATQLWERWQPEAEYCYLMTQESLAFSERKARIVQFDFEGNRIEDGHLVKIPLKSREDAVNMMHMLKLRWEAGIFYCLAAGAGLTYDELEREEADDDGEKYYQRYGFPEFEGTSRYFDPYSS